MEKTSKPDKIIMKKILTYLISYSLFFSCNTPQNKITVINVSENFQEMNFSKIGKSSKIIRLKTSQPIHTPTDILVTQSNIYLFDQNHSGNLWQFDLNGDLLNKKGFYGDQMIPLNGITNYFVHRDSLFLAINGESIFAFDDNLNPFFLKKLPNRAGFIQKIGEKYLMYNNNLSPEVPFQIFFLGSNGTISNSIPVVPKNFNPYFKAYSPFAIQKGKTLTSFPFNDTLYLASEDFTFKPFSKVNFGKRKIPDDFFANVENGYQFYEKLSNSDTYSLHEGLYFGKENQLIATVFHALHYYPLVIDLNSSKAQMISFFLDDMNTGLKVRNKSFADQNQIVFGVSGETIHEQFDSLNKEFRNSLPSDYQNYFYLLIIEI
ncbi:hypothetical protein BC751_0280 [Cecembia calidifontis]|uniref:6-bladed beta-propeller protein n=1 Tax=Cecembia calidifontis TaxID=1187080 RepID=A0A4Q7P484_9BACT|nr:hypothetical protein BC751_0280 [Cecembia calidifontis]